MRTKSLRDELGSARSSAELDIVVPFTTPELTRAAIKAAKNLGTGLRCAIRLLKVQVVPFPMQQSPVHLTFLKKQLESFHSALPLTAHILLAREFEPDLMRVLRPDSIVVLASKNRPWRTRTESIAAHLRRAGHRVILCHTNQTNGASHA